jgi:uncharacterized protein (TIGR02679 family)
MTSASTQQIRATLGTPGLRRLIDRLCERRETNRPLTGTLTLQNATAGERRAIDQLLRRAPTAGTRLAIPLDTLLTRIQDAIPAGDWSTILDTLRGPPGTARLDALARQNAWTKLWTDIRQTLPLEKPFLVKWTEQLKRDGTLKRLAGNDPQHAAMLLRQSLAIIQQLPAQGELLAGLAARVTGHAHALDLNTPLSTLTLRAISAWHETPMPKTAAQRRAHWELAGIACDELSAPALVLNLRLENNTPTGRLLHIAAQAGLPVHISTMALQTIDWENCNAPESVFICENPAIISMAARQHGNKCRPLICTDGEPKTAVWRLLRHLRQKGTALCYHGDFDWGGIGIASRVIASLDARPWRYTTSEYLKGPPGEKLTGNAKPTPWDAPLSTAMSTHGYIIHEEAVAGQLLDDLA